MSRRLTGTVLRGAVLSPVDAESAMEIDRGFVAIDADGRIEAVGVAGDAPGNRPVVDLGAAIVLPAFVDAHVHLPQVDVRGHYGEPLLPWLERFVFPAEAAFADPAHAGRVAERFFAALAAAGVGSAGVFSTVHEEATTRAFEVAEDSGLRVVMGNVLMDRNAPDELLEPAADGIAATRRLAERWDGAAGGRLHVAVTPRFAPTCSEALLAAAGRLARETGLRIQTHLSEQEDEVEAVRRAFPGAADYLDVYDRAGLLRPRAVFAHAIHCADGAYRRIAERRAAVVCCPTSNAFLGSGAFPLARARATGVTIALGSDVGAGPQFSPLDVLRHLAYLDRTAPEELLVRATLAGARALGLDDVTGQLRPGMAADLTVLEPPADAGGGPLERFVQAVFRLPETRLVATLVEGRLVHGTLASRSR